MEKIKEILREGGNKTAFVYTTILAMFFATNLGLRFLEVVWYCFIALFLAVLLEAIIRTFVEK